jgi:hypothetical protein
MIPLLERRTEADGDPYQILEKNSMSERADEIDHRAWTLYGPRPHQSPIYAAWIRYAREYPEHVFGG